MGKRDVDPCKVAVGVELVGYLFAQNKLVWATRVQCAS
jgi:hypothetical protein